ncbi:hypothetical protein LTR43_012112, partial [Exophiala xenobiotica]
MTDLGLAIHRHPDYWDSRSTPTRDRTGRPPQLLGTCRYASVNGHLGVGMQAGGLTRLAAQSRRDDLEALGYMLVYFMRGRLPWQGNKTKRDAKYLLVLEKKQATSASELCVDLPPPFEKYVHYVHNLHDEDLPDYQGLREMFYYQVNHIDHVYDFANHIYHVHYHINQGDYINGFANHIYHVYYQVNHRDYINDFANHIYHINDQVNHIYHVYYQVNHLHHVHYKVNHIDHINDFANHIYHVYYQVNHIYHVYYQVNHLHHVHYQ